MCSFCLLPCQVRVAAGVQDEVVSGFTSVGCFPHWSGCFPHWSFAQTHQCDPQRPALDARLGAPGGVARPWLLVRPVLINVFKSMFMFSNWPIEASTKIQFLPQSSPEISASHFMRSCNSLKRFKLLVLPDMSFCASGGRLPLRQMVCSPSLKNMMVMSTRRMSMAARSLPRRGMASFRMSSIWSSMMLILKHVPLRATQLSR